MKTNDATIEKEDSKRWKNIDFIIVPTKQKKCRPKFVKTEKIFRLPVKFGNSTPTFAFTLTHGTMFMFFFIVKTQTHSSDSNKIESNEKF